MRNIFGFGLAAAVTVFFISGCGNGDGDTTTPPESTDISVEVYINSSTAEVLRGGEVTVSSIVLPKQTTDKTVEWSIDEETHPDTKIYINQKKQICLSVAEDETLTTLTVRARSVADPEKSGTKKVTIPVPTVERVEISLAEPWVVPWERKVDVGPDSEMEFTVKVIGKNFIREVVTWSIDDAGKNANTTINEDADGVAHLHVAQGETLKSFKVQAVSKWDAGKTGEVTVTVKEPDITGVVIRDEDGNEIINNPKNPTRIQAGSNEDFRVIVTGTGKVSQDVTWEIERLSYSIIVHDIQINRFDEPTNGWGMIPLEIDLTTDDVTLMWVSTGVPSSTGTGSYVFDRTGRVERIPGSQAVTIWEFDEFTGVSKQITLDPATGATKIDETGKFTVDGAEIYGKFKLTAIPAADPTAKKWITVEIVQSGAIAPPEPPQI